MINRQCLIEVPNAPRHRAERVQAEADYDVETALESCCYTPAGHRPGPLGPTDS